MTSSDDTAMRAINDALRLASSGRIAEAIRRMETGREGELDHPVGRDLLGRLYFQAGDVDKALAAFEAAVAMAPGFADAHCNRGVALQRLGRLDEALAAYEATLRHAPRHATAHFNRGNILKLKERLDEAAASFDAALAAAPGMTEAVLNRGRVHLDRRDFPSALADFDRVLAADTASAEAGVGRATALFRLGRHAEALVAVDSVLAREPKHGDAALVRGRILMALDRDAEALAVFGALAARGSVDAKPLVFQASILAQLGRSAEAQSVAEQAVARNPSDAQAHEALGAILLAAGDYERGLGEQEWRVRSADFRRRRALPGVPFWESETLAGKRIAVVSEQGIGDTIQFMRYADRLVSAGAEVAGLVPSPLLAVARTYPGKVAWFDAIRDMGPVDLQVPVVSLPYRFGTRRETIPARLPYLFADAERRSAWQARLGGGGFRVGINWQGNPNYENDRRRSVRLLHFAALAAIPGIRLISLQAVHGLDQLERLPAGMAVETLGPLITDNPDGLAEIAAVIASLDLVVTSDTSAAHLAGALGASVWVALGFAPDWRWGYAGDVSPWYPTMRLFRQPAMGDWPAVFAAIAAALAERVAARNRR